MKYEGWKNIETFTVFNYLNNNKKAYDMMIYLSIYDESHIVAKCFIEQAIKFCDGLDNELTEPINYLLVDWLEIFEEFKTKAEEIESYDRIARK